MQSMGQYAKHGPVLSRVKKLRWAPASRGMLSLSRAAAGGGMMSVTQILIVTQPGQAIG